MNDLVDQPEPAYPFPPRFWWLKRLIVGSILVTLAYAALMAWWWHEADRRLEAEIDAIHSRGEPVLLEDFSNKPAVPDADNAALSLSTAASSVTFSQAETDLLAWFDLNVPVDARTMSTLAKFHQSITKARELSRLARFQREADWGLTIRSPVMAMGLPALNQQRELSSWLSFDALYDHLAGNDAEAIELAHDILHQSDVVNEYGPFLISHLVAISTSTEACQTVRALSYDLAVLPDRNASTQPTGSGAASRDQIQALIVELLDERAFRRGLSNGMNGERLLQFDFAANPGPARLITANTPLMGLFAPVFKLDTIHLMRITTRARDITAAAANYPAAATNLPDPPSPTAPGPLVERLSTLLSECIGVRHWRQVEGEFEGLAERRIAALRLAIRLYELDHNGELPGRLDQLSPDYLGVLPADPFATDGRTFGYRVSPTPLLYSVGINGTDDGASTALPAGRQPTTVPAGHPYDNSLWDRADVIFPLNKPDPLPPDPSDGG